jgi:hypothetical protein
MEVMKKSQVREELEGGDVKEGQGRRQGEIKHRHSQVEHGQLTGIVVK